MVRAPFFVAVALLASCATTPRAANGPHPQLGADDSVDLTGAASIIIKPPPPVPPTVSSVQGPFCGEIVGEHAHRPGTLCPVDPDSDAGD